MNSEQYVFIAAAIMLACALGYFLLPVYADFRDAKRAEEKLNEELLYLDYEFREVQEEIHALKNNPKAVERVAREKFNWCRPEEKIYHFDPPHSLAGRGRRGLDPGREP
jgi:cell division protein FtsB